MPARILGLLVAVVIFVLAFFFLAAALVAGVLLAAVLLARIWWIQRRIRKAAVEQVLSAEYTVVERESQPARLPDERAPPDDPSRGDHRQG